MLENFKLASDHGSKSDELKNIDFVMHDNIMDTVTHKMESA